MIDQNYTRLPVTWQEMATRIDYSDLRVDTREKDIRLLCLEAEKYCIPTVVVNPVNVSLAAKFRYGTDVKVAAALSYPVGAYEPEEKILEVKDALEDGVDEIYMLMAVGAYRNGWIDRFTLTEIEGLAKAAMNHPTRLITEASVLNDNQKREVCRLAAYAGINTIVACTGFLPGKLPPVSLHDLDVLVNAANNELDVYFMGEVKDFERARELFECGIARLCTPSARQILAYYPDFPGIP